MQCIRPNHVLHVTPYAAHAWAYGGIPRLADAFARGLGARGHRVTVCATDACDARRRLTRPEAGSRLEPWRPQQISQNVELRVFPNVSNWLAYHYQVFLPAGFSRYLERHAAEFDVAHLHACRNLPGIIAASQLRRANVPYIVAPNGTAPNLERRHTAKRAFDAAFGTVLDDAAKVVAVSAAERRQLLELGVRPERIAMVPNPLVIEEFERPGPRRFRQRFRIGGRLVAYLGKLTPRKRVDLLVRAFAALRLADATLVVAGNDMGAEAAARKAVRDTGVEKRTIFTGLLEGADRIDLLACADVVVYPSEYEIFGLVPLEALLCGTPVAVADDSGCGEVIASTGGGLVVPGTVAAFRSAIQAILDAPAYWRAAVTEAAKRVRAWYASEIVCAQLERVYAEVLAAR